MFLAEPRNVIVAGIRRDGRPHLSPNWFYWDGQHFYVSTTRSRVKYAIFRRDPRAQLLIDDSTRFRAVLVAATVEIREDLAAAPPPAHADTAAGPRPPRAAVARGPPPGSLPHPRLGRPAPVPPPRRCSVPPHRAVPGPDPPARAAAPPPPPPVSRVPAHCRVPAGTTRQRQPDPTEPHRAGHPIRRHPTPPAAWAAVPAPRRSRRAADPRDRRRYPWVPDGPRPRRTTETAAGTGTIALDK